MSPNRPKTIKDRALEQLRKNPWRTSYEIAMLLKSELGDHVDCSGTLSSLFAKMTKEGLLIRRDGYGPKRGYGYAFPDQEHYVRQGDKVFSTLDRPTLWEHLSGD